ncbi:hypothetical protein EDC01DRAFT_756172 [Geopyxis carbonaria]|nr:hypothetical protein EDC01DRAFT_756172 [Geopyxis carbonaria]
MAKALILKKVEGKPGEVYYPLELTTLPLPPPGPDQVHLTFLAASLNHRDLFQRRHLYPGISFTAPLGSDGVALVTGPPSHPLLNRRVLPCPGRGWTASPLGPESAYATLGASTGYPAGTLATAGIFDASELEEAPPHLTDPEAAALPLCGLTAWRAVKTKARVHAGDNVLVTGIGGGVALAALAFAAASGARVFVTSSSPAKLARAKELGASAGVLYTGKAWGRELAALLPADRPWLDCVIDGAGGSIVADVGRVLKQGGRVVSYGMTTGPSMPWGMGAVLRNVELLGSTMGSRREFAEMCEFVREHGIRPVVDSVVEGLEVEGVEGLFGKMERGGQFGKLVVRIGERPEGEAKL